MIRNNIEIQNVVKIMGLKFNTRYENVNSLRYGRIMIMTDQDVDGHHIKGLIINLIQHYFPSLMSIKGFICQFITPIIKVKHNSIQHQFFNINDFN